MYVFSSNIINHESYQVKINKDTQLDIETWNPLKLKSIVESNTKDLGYYKIVERIFSGYLVEQNISVPLKDYFDYKSLKKSVIDLYLLESRSFIEDAKSFIDRKEFILADEMTYLAIRKIALVYCAFYDEIILKEKWTTKAFLGLQNVDQTTKDNYIKFQIYPEKSKENIRRHLTDHIDFTSGLLSEFIFLT